MTHDADGSSAILVRALSVFLVILAVEVLHGVLRARHLLPLVGDFHSRQIGVVTGSLLIVAITLATSRWIGARTRAALLGVGALWATLMIAFEIALGRVAFGFPWSRILEDFDLPNGGLLPLGIAVLALAPLLAARVRGLRRDG